MSVWGTPEDPDSVDGLMEVFRQQVNAPAPHIPPARLTALRERVKRRAAELKSTDDFHRSHRLVHIDALFPRLLEAFIADLFIAQESMLRDRENWPHQIRFLKDKISRPCDFVWQLSSSLFTYSEIKTYECRAAEWKNWHVRASMWQSGASQAPLKRADRTAPHAAIVIMGADEHDFASTLSLSGESVYDEAWHLTKVDSSKLPGKSDTELSTLILLNFNRHAEVAVDSLPVEVFIISSEMLDAAGGELGAVKLRQVLASGKVRA